jgi:hypothetical protein
MRYAVSGVLGLALGAALSGAIQAAPVDGFAGTYRICDGASPVGWRLAPQGADLAVSIQLDAKAAWKKDVVPATPLSDAELAALNATGSSRAAADQAQAALAWNGAHFLRMPSGWFERYRQAGQTFTPDLILVGGGTVNLLCRR